MAKYAYLDFGLTEVERLNLEPKSCRQKMLSVAQERAESQAPGQLRGFICQRQKLALYNLDS